MTAAETASGSNNTVENFMVCPEVRKKSEVGSRQRPDTQDERTFKGQPAAVFNNALDYTIATSRHGSYGPVRLSSRKSN
jgi:hypothetical protein